MKLAALALALASVVAAFPSEKPTTILGTLVKRENVDYTEFVPAECKDKCQVMNEMYAAWDAKDCNKNPTDDCNKLACSFVDRQLDCGECQLRTGGDDIVTPEDLDKQKTEARSECVSLGYPTHA